MGLSIQPSSSEMSESHYHTHKVFLLCNYVLLGAASSCIFLTLSLRLIPSVSGFFLILLHVLTIGGAVFGCHAATVGKGQWYAAHMVYTVLTAIFQGSVAVLIFTRTDDFLGGLKSYVQNDDGAVILRLAGGLCMLIFAMEWVVLALAFVLRYYDYMERDGNAMKRSSKVQEEDTLGNWPCPFQI